MSMSPIIKGYVPLKKTNLSFIAFAVIMFSFIFARSCDNSDDNKFIYSARMGGLPTLYLGVDTTKPKVDSVQLLQQQWNKYADSLLNHTSIFQFQNWLFENATVKQYQEGKFVDFYNAYLQSKQQLWIQKKQKL